ncbi:hypothetical protein EOL96_09240, partial [Candidatus Saccharibacteria bacterium]|nr:hypothetical protein [Candidatus Saccharibacteria bacterium]
MAKWSELYGIEGSKYTKDTVDFLDKTNHEYYQTSTPAVRTDLSGNTIAGFKSFDYKEKLTTPALSLMASEPSNLTDFQKWQQSNVEKFNAQ